MAKINYSSRALADLEGNSDFLFESGLNALETLDLTDEAVTILARRPLVGRQAESRLRELMISQGGTAYVALYTYEAGQDAILVLAIRYQREAGFHGQTSN